MRGKIDPIFIENKNTPLCTTAEQDPLCNTTDSLQLDLI